MAETDPISSLFDEAEEQDRLIAENKNIQGPIRNVLRLQINATILKMIEVFAEEFDFLHDRLDAAGISASGNVLTKDLRAQIDEVLAMAASLGAVAILLKGEGAADAIQIAKSLNEKLPLLKEALDAAMPEEEDEEDTGGENGRSARPQAVEETP
jgi:hypothetical protein